MDSLEFRLFVAATTDIVAEIGDGDVMGCSRL